MVVLGFLSTQRHFPFDRVTEGTPPLVSLTKRFSILLLARRHPNAKVPDWTPPKRVFANARRAAPVSLWLDGRPPRGRFATTTTPVGLRIYSNNGWADHQRWIDFSQGLNYFSNILPQESSDSLGICFLNPLLISIWPIF